MPRLSILCPSIRSDKLINLYKSIPESFSDTWELIVISPYVLPTEVKADNVRLIQDMGTPIRCQQIGLINATGDYITWAADDGYFLAGALDIAFEKLKNQDYKTLIMGKYVEGEYIGDFDNSYMLGDTYYYLKKHRNSEMKFIPDDALMLNVGVVSRQLLNEIGGWDCQFEVCPMAYNDCAIRLKRYGAKFIIQNELMFKCSHLPGRQGDHAPIHTGQVYHDQPLFNYIYSSPDAVNRIKIDIDNWKESPTKWLRRWGHFQDGVWKDYDEIRRE